ncbi:MAG: ABC transporter ATP-binding protein/permease [Clostridiales bacterium]|nr:ABC transporter ATP-binding protein/permease [Clostridiales bacterium]MDD7594861.1 ABC transporter ATP-binding protein [Clostridiales bacterium]
MRTILSYLKPHRRFMCLSLSIKFVGTLMELALPYILSHIIQNVIKPLGVEASPDLGGGSRRIVIWALIMIVCAFLGVVGNVTANRMSARTAKDVARAVRHDLFERTMRLSPSQTDAFTIESLESRITGDTYNIHNFINTMQRMGVRAPILLIGGLAITATLDPVLTLVMVAVLPFIFIAVYGITSRGLPLYTRVREAVDSMTRVVREDAQGVRVIKALSKTDYECRRFDRENAALAATERKTNSVMSLANPLMNMFMNLGITAVVVVGAFRVNGGLSEPGKIIAFIQYFTLISMAMMSVSRIFLIISKASASAERIEEVLKTPEDLAVEPESAYPRRRESGIVFDNVSFAYNGKGKVLKNISFSLPKGGTLGIIGATGSGKTTLLSLLMRFYDVSEGAVRIDGRDVRTIPKEELHSMFGVAMQNDFICADTVEENINFGRGLSHEDIVRAAKIAQADEFISHFPEKYEHGLTAKGTNVSGGQRQRLFISRAIAARPQILVLDDASSALDYKTDAALRRALREEIASEGGSVIVVAQRVSSVMNSDLILVLDKGEIIGMGTHDELMENCEVYREISQSQMGGAFLE